MTEREIIQNVRCAKPYGL